MISYIYYLLGWEYYTKDIMCVNSFANTERRFNFVVQKFATDDD